MLLEVPPVSTEKNIIKNEKNPVGTPPPPAPLPFYVKKKKKKAEGNSQLQNGALLGKGSMS